MDKEQLAYEIVDFVLHSPIDYQTKVYKVIEMLGGMR